METLPVLYHDQQLIAVHKPSGLLVHRSLIDKNETRFALQIVRDQIGQAVYPLHRLDKPTSGVLLFALSADVARLMMPQFTLQQTQKTYLAIVRGITNEHQLIDYPLKEELDKTTDSRAQQDKPAQAAVTELTRLATIELPFAVGRYATSRYSLLQLQPKTGRKHQLRRHLKHIFHPIIGDTTHGDGKQNTFFRQQFNNQRLLLAATSLQLQHPITQQNLCIQAPVADDFQNIIKALGWQYPSQESSRDRFSPIALRCINDYGNSNP